MNGRITGYVDFSLLYPFIKIRLISSSNEVIELPAIVDTGYNGEVILPQSRIQELGLQYLGTSEGELANGQIGELELYRGDLEWFDAAQEIIVGSTHSNKAFVGTSLLMYCVLRVDFKRGDVTIERLI